MTGTLFSKEQHDKAVAAIDAALTAIPTQEILDQWRADTGDVRRPILAKLASDDASVVEEGRREFFAMISRPLTDALAAKDTTTLQAVASQKEEELTYTHKLEQKAALAALDALGVAADQKTILEPFPKRFLHRPRTWLSSHGDFGGTSYGQGPDRSFPERKK